MFFCSVFSFFILSHEYFGMHPIKAWMAACFCFKIIFPNSLWRILSCFITLPSSHSVGGGGCWLVGWFFLFYFHAIFFERRSKWLNFVCIRIKIRSERMEVIHKFSIHSHTYMWVLIAEDRERYIFICMYTYKMENHRGHCSFCSLSQHFLPAPLYR